jgi:thiamine-monophosphate kinase
MKTIGHIGEDALISRLLELVPTTNPALHTGPGDDCAVVEASSHEWQLLKTDAIVENVHFTADASMRRVGWKAIARVISDIAAMGGRPQWFLVTIGMPAHYELEKIEQLYLGMADCLNQYGGVICGGESTRVSAGAGLVISIAATGLVKKRHLLQRSTAQRGDAIYVTGRLGGSLGGRHLDITPRLREAHWLAANRFATAMMDLSDGLAKDLPRLAKASGLGINIDPSRLPCHDNCRSEQALGDGEDYELLFTVNHRKTQRLAAQWPEHFSEVPLTCIGTMVAAGDGMMLSGGWDHFR